MASTLLTILIICKLMILSQSLFNETEDMEWISSTTFDSYDTSDQDTLWEKLPIVGTSGWDTVSITVCIAAIVCCTICVAFVYIYHRRNKRVDDKIQIASLEHQELSNIKEEDMNDEQMNIIKLKEEEPGNIDTDDEELRPKIVSKGNDNDNYNKLHFICYLLVCIFWGNISSLPGSLIDEIKDELHSTTDLEVSDILISRQISFNVASLITAYIIDKFVNTHRWIALSIFNGLICMIFIPFIDNIYYMHLLWIAIGFAHGAIEVGIPVFIFRGFSNNNVWMMALCIQCFTKTISPIIIEFNIKQFDDFSHSLLLFAAIGLTSFMFLLCLPTPIHDKYRSIKLESEKSSKTTEQIMMEIHKSFKTKSSLYGLIALFSVFWLFYCMLGVSMTTFITLYCKDYLNNDVIGRYLISVYFAGTLLYFFVKLILCKDRNAKADDNDDHKSIFLLLCGGQIICCLLGIVWAVIIPFDLIMYGLFVIFAVVGYISSFTYPAIYNLCESIYPINGTISCIFTLSQGIGATAILFIIGEYGDIIHPILPYTVVISSIILTVLVLFIFCVHRRYKKYYDQVVSVNMMRRFSSVVF